MIIKNEFMSESQLKEVVGHLKPSELVEKKIHDTITPTHSLTQTVDEDKVLEKKVTSYYYVNDEMQILVVEVKYPNNQTKEFTEKIWEYDKNTGNYNHEKYYNGFLKVVREEEKGYGKPEEIVEFEGARNQVSQQLFGYDPTTCITDGSCCEFEGQTYEYCGKYCGVDQSTGGGMWINYCDYCCRLHDFCLQDVNNANRCDCDEDLNQCLGNNSCPGDTTMGSGIRAAALIADCDYEGS